MLSEGATIALIGASGHGKSSLTNALVGADHLLTKQIRDDGKGRHTSVRRELVLRARRGSGHRHARAAKRRTARVERRHGGGVSRRSPALPTVPVQRLHAHERAGLCGPGGGRDRRRFRPPAGELAGVAGRARGDGQAHRDPAPASGAQDRQAEEEAQARGSEGRALKASGMAPSFRAQRPR